MKKTLLLINACIVMLALFAQPVAKKFPVVDIPFKKFVLSNGLTLIVHEDHKAPIIAFNV